MGEGYTRVLGAEKLPNDGVFYPAEGASIESYELPGYFDAHAHGSGLTFGGAAYAHSRILIQVHLVSFGPPHAAISHPLSNGCPCDARANSSSFELSKSSTASIRSDCKLQSAICSCA